MRADLAPDHGRLARLAQSDAGELRPLLLRVHVQSFVADRRRDPADAARFEAIVLGLLPLVPDDSAAEAARMLLGVPGVPAAVLAAFAGRVDATGEDEARSRKPRSRAKPRPEPELPTRLSGAALDEAIARAGGDSRLAAALLARPDLGPFDRAALYRHGDEAARTAIRRDLATALASLHRPPPSGAGEAARALLAVAGRGDPGATVAALAARLGVAAAPFDLSDEVGQELLVLGLVAAGLDGHECTRALLLLGAPLSRSVAAVFRLAGIAAATPRAVAAYLVGHERLTRRRAPEAAPAARPLATLRAEPAAPLRRADRPARDRAASARADRRS